MEPEGKSLLNRFPVSAAETGRLLLSSYGQFLFSDRLFTGAAMALGLALISDTALFFSGLGILFGCGAAAITNRDRQKIRKGFYGFNGGLFGLFWSWYFQGSAISLLLFVVFAAVLAFGQIAWERLWRPDRTGIPMGSLPAALFFLFLLYPLYGITVQWRWLPAATLYLPLGAEFKPLIELPLLQSDGLAFLGEHYLHAWVVILSGVLFHSRIGFGAALYGLAMGWILTRLWPVSADAAPVVFIAFNALPLAMAFGGLFLAATPKGFLFMNAALLVCGLIWAASTMLLNRLHLPYLTLPFNLTFIGGLAWLRAGGRGQAQFFVPGLTEVDTAEKTLRAYHELMNFKNEKRAGVQTNRDTQKADQKAAFRDLLVKSKRISILSGAGTSTESGIPDIRGRSPFWEQFRPEVFMLDQFLAREEVRREHWAMDGLFYRLVREALPNRVHRAVKKLVDQSRLECVVTQNVDGLFQRSGIGPEKIIEIHGSCLRIRCLACRSVFSRAELGSASLAAHAVTHCNRCGGLLKPDTVWMGEPVDPVLLGEAVFRICASDLLLIIGTTLIVEPVASLPRVALEKGVTLAIVNLTPTPFDDRAALAVREQAGPFFERAGY